MMAGLAAVVSLAGCGSEDASSGPVSASPTTSRLSPAPTSDGPVTATRLTVKVQASAKAPARTWVLNCDPPGGDHPAAQASCQAIAKAPDVFKPTPADRICTEIYGGPEIATVSGTWRGKPVSSKFTRLNGCEIHRWSMAGPLLGQVPPVR